MRSGIAIATLALAAQVQAAGLADPTLPPPDRVPRKAVAAPRRPASLPTLQGVLVGPQRRLAILDGRAVPEGGRVGGWRVARVVPGAVELVGAAGRVRLRVLPPGAVTGR